MSSLIAKPLGQKIALTFLGALTFASMACETADDNTLEKARNCVNSAGKLSFTNLSQAQTNAAVCDQMVTNANLNSYEALKIRFGALVIETGLITQISTIANTIKNGGTNSGLSTVVSFLAGVSQSNANEMSDLANRTQDSGMLYFASLIQMGVALNNVTNINPGDPSGVATAIQSCTANPCLSTVASSFQTFQAGACQNPSDQASTDPNNLCYISKQVLSSAGLSTDASQLTPSQIQQALATYLQ